VARYLLHVVSKPFSGHDPAFNDWYNKVHLSDVLAVAGFTAASRFSALPMAPSDAPRDEYLAMYELETDDPHATLARLNEAAASMQISPALDMSSVRMELFQQITPRMEPKA
jgi:hypothetical protein